MTFPGRFGSRISTKASFRVAKKIFATMDETDGYGRWTTPDQQAMMTEVRPDLTRRCRAPGAIPESTFVRLAAA